MNGLIKAALIRAFRTVCQELATTLPAGVVITPAIIQAFDIHIVYIILAWLATGLLGGLAAFLTAIATGLPEVEYEQNIYMNADEPADSEVEDENE